MLRAIKPTFSTFASWWARPENWLLPVLLVLAFPLYYELGRNPVQLWDESRQAVSAAEMVRDGHWLVPHFDGVPDHWNTKPPLLIWLQAFSFKLFGLSTWALRLPTLLATLGTVLLLFRFAARALRQPLAGVLAVVVLMTSLGYIRLHVARTGDYDALLTFWQVVLWSQFFQYLETRRPRHLWWATLALTAATFTKGPAALLGLPGLLAYALGGGHLGWLLRQRRLYLAAGSWLLLVGGYLLVREHLDPGYWQAVQANDLGGRFLHVIEFHDLPWYYYLHSLTDTLFANWLGALGLALLVGWLQPPSQQRQAMGLLAAFAVGWLLVISVAKTKLAWYDAPLYPALALLVGLGLEGLGRDLWPLYQLRLRNWSSRLVLAGLAMVGLYGAYYGVVRQLIDERHSDFGAGHNGQLARYLEQYSRQPVVPTTLTVLTNGEHYQALQYYRLQLQQATGWPPAIFPGNQARRLALGTVVVVCDPAYQAVLDSAFQVAELHRDGRSGCQTLRLVARKAPAR